jgi:hypothetical protein
MLSRCYICCPDSSNSALIDIAILREMTIFMAAGNAYSAAMAQIPLSLDPNSSGNNAASGPTGGGAGNPVMGWFGVGFGLLGIFTIGFIFVPLGLICSVLALFMGQAVWGFIGILLAVAGLITSPKLWLIIGMGAFYGLFDSNEFMKSIFEFINSIFGDGGGTREV